MTVFWARYCSSCTIRSFFFILENKIICYSDDSTLMAVVPKVYITTGIPTRVVGTCFFGKLVKSVRVLWDEVICLLMVGWNFWMRGSRMFVGNGRFP